MKRIAAWVTSHKTWDTILHSVIVQWIVIAVTTAITLAWTYLASIPAPFIFVAAVGIAGFTLNLINAFNAYYDRCKMAESRTTLLADQFSITRRIIKEHAERGCNVTNNGSLKGWNEGAKTFLQGVLKPKVWQRFKGCQPVGPLDSPLSDRQQTDLGHAIASLQALEATLVPEDLK